jgi:hypothetical protein
MTARTSKFLAIILIVFLSLWGCEEFVRRKIGGFAGSYPFTESWELKATEAEVLSAIVELKKNYPDLQPPNQKKLYEPRDSNSSYWLYIDFYYADTKEVVHTWIRPAYEDSTVTTFAFISLSELEYPSSYRLINRDFWYVANKYQIHKFRSTLVDRIRENLQKQEKVAHISSSAIGP